jgi:two-component system, chemotaxis family, chemotaxis protein CheY
VSSKATVLVVDDDADIRDFMELGLLDAGYQVLSADNGAAALSVLDRRPSDLILLDMRMPVMDGWEFARAYRERPAPHAPIVVVTAAHDAARRAVEIGAKGYLAKPFGLDQLTDTVGRHLQG